jgi:steroid delta-isomerase-like uncharacterized protein
MATDWVNEYLDVWATRSGTRIVEWMTEDCVYEDVTLGEVHKGRADIAAFIDSMGQDLSDDYRLDLVAAASTEDDYHVEWVLKGTHNGPHGPFPATGKAFEIRGVSVGTRAGGKIQANRDYWDMASFLRQVGLAPAPPG